MKNLYLFGAIVLFVVLLIPFFQSLATQVNVIFFMAQNANFSAIYRLIVLLSGGLWMLLTLYLQRLLADIKNQKESSFDL